MSQDSLLNGLAGISEQALLQLRRHLTRAALKQGLIEGKRGHPIQDVARPHP
ncbi:MAG: hypothetical protein GY807_24155, partial [Gammaproteobacteria bacterium]|nr:hypothetical protein [Gammaproteobacteria bacterium]